MRWLFFLIAKYASELSNMFNFCKEKCLCCDNSQLGFYVAYLCRPKILHRNFQTCLTFVKKCLCCDNFPLGFYVPICVVQRFCWICREISRVHLTSIKCRFVVLRRLCSLCSICIIFLRLIKEVRKLLMRCFLCVFIKRLFPVLLRSTTFSPGRLFLSLVDNFRLLSPCFNSLHCYLEKKWNLVKVCIGKSVLGLQVIVLVMRLQYSLRAIERM